MAVVWLLYDVHCSSDHGKGSILLPINLWLLLTASNDLYS